MLPLLDGSPLKIPQQIPGSADQFDSLRWCDRDAGCVLHHDLAQPDPIIKPDLCIAPRAPIDPHNVCFRITRISGQHSGIRLLAAGNLDHIPCGYAKSVHKIPVDACDILADIPVICLCHPERDFLCAVVHVLHICIRSYLYYLRMGGQGWMAVGGCSSIPIHTIKHRPHPKMSF